jgi:hypothetical protein
VLGGLIPENKKHLPRSLCTDCGVLKFINEVEIVRKALYRHGSPHHVNQRADGNRATPTSVHVRVRHVKIYDRV